MLSSSDNVLGRLPISLAWGMCLFWGTVEPALSESLGMRQIPMEWEWDVFSKKMQCQADENDVSYSLATCSVAHRKAAALAPGSCQKCVFPAPPDPLNQDLCPDKIPGDSRTQ